MNTREIGKKYEDLACEYLISIGYVIVGRNFYTKKGEIDIIAKDKDYLCFIEVKYRKSGSLAVGLEAVDKKKQNRIYDTAKYYMYINKYNDNTLCRFDVISIDGDDITLIKNAFYK